jgi:hypothetical protein
MASLTSFLVRMTQDPSLLQAFRSDPTATMTRAGLSDEDKEVLLSRDPERLEAAIDPDDAEGADLDLNWFWAGPPDPDSGD